MHNPDKSNSPIDSPAIANVGIGLRACHYPYILANLPPVPWFEVLTENYLIDGGMVKERLKQIRENYPIVLHGVGMSLGSVDPLNHHYLQQLTQLIQDFQPAYVSDHLCWVSFGQQYLHELLPLPHTEEAIQHVAARIIQVQDLLNQQILIENVSSYFRYKISELHEWEFINAVAQAADCYILLDINNVFVNAYNHGFDPITYLQSIDKTRVKQMHLAGFSNCHTHLLDTHGAAVNADVWQLYALATQKLGNIPTCIEWDNDIPEFSQLWQEAQKAQDILKNYVTL